MAERKPLEPVGWMDPTHGSICWTKSPFYAGYSPLYTADQILWAATLAFNQPPPEGLEMEQVSLWVDGADAALDALLRDLGITTTKE